MSLHHPHIHDPGIQHEPSPNAWRSSMLSVPGAALLRGQRYFADTEGFDYDVALSFSGSDREYAEQLADQLRLNGIAVF